MRQPRGLVVVGPLAVAAGGLVLVSPGSRHADFGWFAYAPPPPDYLDSLVVVNRPRALGGGLMVVGLGLLMLAFGLVRGARARGLAPRSSLLGPLVVAVLAVVAGVVGWALPRSYVTTGGPPPDLVGAGGRATGFPTLAWAPGQVVGAGVSLLGFLLLTGCLGFALGRRHRA